MRILITNHSLSRRAGTELVVYEIALSMMNRGHEVAAYSSRLGEVAELLTAASIPVIHQPESCPFEPDIIHAQHHLDAMTALLAFPNTPAVYHAHGGVPWVERAPAHPRILHYLARCDDLAEVLRHELSLPRDHVSTLPNWVDLDRFHHHRAPLAPPQRALLFGGGLDSPEMHERLSPAFAHRGITLDTLATWTDTERRNPELVLSRYDIVLASGRSALEAMSSGCAVIIANKLSCLSWVTPETFPTLRRHNFAPKRPDPGFNADTLANLLSTYAPESALETTRLTREQCGLPQAMDQLTAIHHQVVDTWKQHRPTSPAATQDLQERERLAVLSYHRQLATAVRDVEAMHVSNRALEKQVTRSDKEHQKLQATLQKLEEKQHRAASDRQLVKKLRSRWWGKLALKLCR